MDSTVELASWQAGFTPAVLGARICRDCEEKAGMGARFKPGEKTDEGRELEGAGLVNWREWASRIGARLGNWNDARERPDSRSERSRLYRVVEALAGWLYVRPDRRSGS
jgi:hypothetical protein